MGPKSWELLPPGDASLARMEQSTYVQGAEGYYSGCVAFSLPVQRRNLQVLEISAFFRLL